MSVTFFAVDAAQDTAELEPNLNNANAALVLDALGFGDDVRAGDLAGETPAADFRGRVLLALGLALADEGVPAYDGRRPSYLQDRLSKLLALVQAAGDGATIAWS